MNNKYVKINSAGQFFEEYSLAQPFRHIVLDNIWNEDMLDLARQEVENFSLWAGEKSFYGSRKNGFKAIFLIFHLKLKNYFII